MSTPPHYGPPSWRLFTLTATALTLCLMSFAEDTTVTALAMTDVSAPTQVAAKRVRHAKGKMKDQPMTVEAAAVSAVVQKHLKMPDAQGKARIEQLVATPPSGNIGLNEWRKQIRAAMAAARKESEMQESAMRAELDAADDARHPEDQEDRSLPGE
jgi:hypothetical protein